jgi:RNA polymerase sigma-70 factor (ECF subfamily)
VAHNTGVDFLKSQRKHTINIDDLEEVLPSGSKLIEDMAMEVEKKEGLAKKMAMLELKYREVLLLYYMEEKSYEEISEIIRVPVSTVGVLIMRAKKKLRELYEKK